MLGPGGFIRNFFVFPCPSNNVSGKLGQLNKVRTDMNTDSVEVNFCVAQPGKNPLPPRHQVRQRQ